MTSPKRAPGMPLIYPCARTDDTVETLAGVSFPDPFRWHEGGNEEVTAWEKSQAALGSEYVRDWPYFSQIQSLVSRFNTERFVALPRYSSGLWFRMHRPEGAGYAKVLVGAKPTGDGRVLFDPATESVEHRPFVSWISPSPDGQTL